MFGNPSLMTRIAIGKGIGLIIGLACMIAIPYMVSDVGWLPRWGILLWYPTVGAIIGVYGVITRHPVLHLPLPWWVRAPLIGAWMNFVLTFFAFDTLRTLLQSMIHDPPTTAPFWFVLEGAIVGLIIGFLAPKFGGEGKEAVDT